jgi:hypothetical protein
MIKYSEKHHYSPLEHEIDDHKENLGFIQDQIDLDQVTKELIEEEIHFFRNSTGHSNWRKSGG